MKRELTGWWSSPGWAVWPGPWRPRCCSCICSWTGPNCGAASRYWSDWEAQSTFFSKSLKRFYWQLVSNFIIFSPLLPQNKQKGSAFLYCLLRCGLIKFFYFRGETHVVLIIKILIATPAGQSKYYMFLLIIKGFFTSVWSSSCFRGYNP